MSTLTYLAREARIAGLQALIERERAVRLAHLHTGEDLLELYRRSDAAFDAAVQLQQLRVAAGVARGQAHSTLALDQGLHGRYAGGVGEFGEGGHCELL